MRKFYTIVAASLLAASCMPAVAADGKDARIAPPSGKETIVETQPSGELTLYSRTCRAHREFYGVVEQIIEEGSVVYMVEQKDGSVWLHNTISMFNAPGWVKAEKSGDKLTITGPQLVYEEYDWEANNGSYLQYFITPVEIYEYENETGDLMRTYRPTEDGVFSFSINGNTIKQDGDGSLILGLVTYTEKNGYFFTGYGDNYIVLSLPEDEPVEVPASAEIYENWAMHYYSGDYENAKFVDVAVDGNDYYIKGIYPELPDVWVKGTLEGNTITFPNFQFIGPNLEWNYFVYLCGGQLMPSDDDDEIMEAIIDPEGFVMTLEDDGTLFAETNIIFATSPDTNPDNANFTSYFEGVYIQPQDPDSFTNPVAPDDIYLGGFDDIPAIEFNLPALDENGNILDESNLYFSAYANSEIYTFTPENCWDLESLGIDGPTTELPYNIGNGYDFYQSGTWHTVYLNDYKTEELFNIGIQSIYYPEGKEVNPDNVLKSDIVYVGSQKDPSAVYGFEVTKEVKSVRYFDMQGREIKSPSSGIYVKKTIFSDGTEKTSKVSLRK